MTDMHALYSLTPLQWHRMIIGYQHRQLDTREEQANAAILFAMSNNGKSLNGVLRKVDEERKKIGLDEREVQRMKAEKAHIRKVQRMEMDEWEKQFAQQLKKEGE